MSSIEDRFKGFGTLAIHAGQPSDPQTGAVIPPIYQTSTFAQESPGKHQGYDYSRADNPTRAAYEKCIAALEGAPHGLAFSSGLAAIDAVIRLLNPGDHVICCDDVYGGTFRLFDKIHRPNGLEFSFIDFSNTEKLEKSFQPNTKMVWLESPTNPLLKILDIERISALAKKNGAVTVVDNTFMSPYFQRPMDLGADIVVHSVTKYMNGHSDIIGGALATRHAGRFEKLKFLQFAVGGVPSPMDCFLAMRGLKTLHVRMDRHQKNAMEIAHFLEGQPKIESVIYPGLESHPQYSIAKKQMSGFGGMISFRIQGGLGEAQKFLESVQIFTLAESLGGVESLIEHPAIMTHASIPPENRKALGIDDNLIRISVGIEELEDLKTDLSEALTRI